MIENEKIEENYFSLYKIFLKRFGGKKKKKSKNIFYDFLNLKN